MMRVCVLGHTGMLGHVVTAYLRQQGCHILTLQERFSAQLPEKFLANLQALKMDCCINCIGFYSRQEAHHKQIMDTNGLLPELCLNVLPNSIHFIQASTDGVFDPGQAGRTANEIGDATDVYGQAKKHAELLVSSWGGHVIRCSIIGPEQGTGRSLLNWVLHQKGPVQGYTNHSWNGITTLEWAKIAWRSIRDDIEVKGPILQPGIYPAVSKCDLLHLIAETWALPIQINSVATTTPVLRSLIPNLKCPPLKNQLIELFSWYHEKIDRPGIHDSSI